VGFLATKINWLAGIVNVPNCVPVLEATVISAVEVALKKTTGELYILLADVKDI
jgi:hypothetical protein